VRDSLITQAGLLEETEKDDDGKKRKTGRVCLAMDDQG
jgi:hypothetical protein